MYIPTEKYLTIINENLNKYIDKKYIGDSYNCLYESVKYSINAGGKRIRPMLLLEFCRICGGDIYKAIPFACAIEMVHTYSLIHDDLPCMDNDDFRRSKKANHIVFGEDIALLAGDSLLTLAFEVMLLEETINMVGADITTKAASVLASNSGMNGMILGQVMDLKNEGLQVDIDVLKYMDERKTGDLIVSAAKMGCIIAGASEDKIKEAEMFARYIGLAFQIVDDILDVTSNEVELGKPIGSDELNNKSTYVSILGIEKAKDLVEDLTSKAIECLEKFGENTDFLKDLAILLCNRKS